MTEFTLLVAKNILNENREYPINFDHLIKWCNVKSREQCLNLLKSQFEYGIDYTTLAESVSIINSINLRLDCSREFALMTKTEGGRQYKRTLLEAEKELGIFSSSQFNQRDKLTINKNSESIKELKTTIHNLIQDISIINQRLDINRLELEQTVKSSSFNLQIEPCNPINIRDNLIHLVNNYANDNYKNTDEERFRVVWAKVHREFFKATRVDLRKRSKSHKPEISGVQYAVQYRLIDLLYQIAKEVLI